MFTPKTSQHTIESESGHYARKVWLLEPNTGKPERIAIFFDGEWYVDHMEAPDLIHELEQKGSIPATACLFVSHVDAEHRHRELTCNHEFADFVAEDVAAWMSQRFPGVSNRWLIAGPSLGGLQAAFVALTHPKLFSRCLSQSGSFWWQDERLTHHLDELPASTSRFWVSVGNQETAFGISHPPTGLRQDVGQVSACERFAKALQERKHSVQYRVFQGRHDFVPWRTELPDALHWLLG